MKLVVLADTHIRSGRSRRLPDEVYAELDHADAVLHAGDVLEADLIDELAGFAPVYAVLGNNDSAELAARLPETRVDEFDGVRIGMIHDSGPTTGRPSRLRRRFADCAVVVFGHSHVPFDGVGIDGQLLFNPGSPTERRSQPVATYGVIDVRAGAIVRHAVLPISRPEG